MCHAAEVHAVPAEKSEHQRLSHHQVERRFCKQQSSKQCVCSWQKSRHQELLVVSIGCGEYRQIAMIINDSDRMTLGELVNQHYLQYLLIFHRWLIEAINHRLVCVIYF